MLYRVKYVRKRKTNIIFLKNMKTNNTYTWNLEKWYRWTYLQGRIRNTDIENRLVDTVWGRRGWDELREQHWHTYTTMGKTASGKLLCNTGSPAWCSWWPRGEEWRRGRSKAQEGGDYTHTHTHTYIYILWLIHIVVWQKSAQHCKAIILQFKYFFM